MTIAGFVGAEPVPRRLIDERVAALHAGPHAAMLPAPGSPEHRQLTRWVAQVVFTEHLCRAEASVRGLATDATLGDAAPGGSALDAAPGGQAPAVATGGVALDQRAAVELGSIAAAAYGGSAVVRAVFAAVTADVRADEDEVRRLFAYRADGLARPARWVLRHGLFADRGRAVEADPAALPSIGAVAGADLPAALAAALAGSGPGDTVGPLRDGLGWHVAHIVDVVPAVAADYATEAPALRAELLAAARRRAFAHWLDRRRGELLTLAPGMEHPGDPRQPDNHHRH